jgi:hypothetical protein
VLCYKKALQNSFIMVTNNLHFENVRKTPTELYCKKVYNNNSDKEQVKIEKTKTVKSKL